MKALSLVALLCVVVACAEDDPARHLPDAADVDAVSDIELAVALAGNGSGSVTSLPAGISCGSDCATTFAQGTTVTLTAVAGEGSVFAGWSGACDGTATTCDVTLAAAAAVTATFELEKHTVTLVKAGQGSGTIQGGGVDCDGTCTVSVDHGSMVSFTASPTGLSVFGGWGAGCSGSGTCTVTVTSDLTIEANFALQNFTLSLTPAGTGSGTVTSSPTGISCGAMCQYTFSANQVVTLTAAASAGSTFAGWSGSGCTGTGNCVVTIDAAKTVTATFTLKTFALNVTKSGNGAGTVASTPMGIDCGATCSHDYNYNDSVTLTATPDAGSVFGGWGGACSGMATTCTVPVTSAKSVTATFTLTTPLLTVTKTGTGTVSSVPAGINCGTTCMFAFNYGAPVTLSAAAGTGFVFTGWGGACSGMSTCSVSMTQARTVSATFTPQYTLTITKSGSGTVTSTSGAINCGATCAAAVTSGTPVTLNAAPSAGYVFTGWSGGGCSGTGACTLTVTANTTVTATFKPQYTLTVAKSGSGTVTSTSGAINCGAMCSATVTSGTPVTLDAAPSAGYVFTGWSGGGCSGTGACTLTMTANTTVTATFKPQYTLTVAKSGSGTVTSTSGAINCGATCSALITSGAQVTLNATAATGYVFTGWSGGGCSNTGSCTLTVTANTLVTATFAPQYTLTVAKSGSGTVTSTSGAINCGATCNATLTSGTPVTLNATPSSGYVFAGWSGGGCNGTGSCTLTVSANTTVTATFKPQYTLTVTKSGSGTVTSTSGAINCGTTCSTTVTSGTPVTLNAAQSSGYVFTGWSGGGCNGTGSCVVTVAANTTVTATFTPLVTLTVSKTGTGFGTVTGGGLSCGNSCSMAVAQGSQVTLTATPDVANATRSSFTGWSVQTCAGTTCTVTVNSNMTIGADFHLSPNYMFVTSEMYTGDLGSIAGADMKCQKLADAANIPGTFRAYLMSSSAAGVWTFANQRFPGVSGWMRVDGVAVADSIDQMHLGQVYNAPLKTEQNVDVTATQFTYAWTSMTRNGPIAGSGRGPCAAANGNESWLSAGSNDVALVGNATATDTSVVNISRWSCSQGARLYCFGSDRAAKAQ